MPTDSRAPGFTVPQYPVLPVRDLQVTRNSLIRSTENPVHRVYLARSAIYLALRAIGAGTGDSVLAPAYICKSAIEPIVATGVSLEFYPINRRCEINASDLERQIRPDTVAVLAVHYFGFPTAIEQLREICDGADLMLIEDCAHVLTGQYKGSTLGTYGDVGLHSYRKFFPAYDGGIMRINRSGLMPKMRLSSVPARIFSRSALHAFSANPSVALVKRNIRDRIINNTVIENDDGVSLPRAVDAFETYTDNFVDSVADYAMSWPSRLVIEHANLEKTVAARRSHFEYLYQRLVECPGIHPLHNTPPPGGAAWVFPAIVPGHAGAHKILRQLGIPATAWDGVRPPQLDDAFPDADFLYDHLIFLPVHQGLTSADLGRIADACQILSRRLANSPV